VIGQANKIASVSMAEHRITAIHQVGGPFVDAVDQTRMPIVFSDPTLPDNPIVYANDAFLRMTGYDREEVLGQSYHFMMGTGTDPAARTQIEEAFHAGHLNDYPEVRYHHKDGSPFWAVMFISLVRDENGKVTLHFASFLDVTRRKQDEERQRFLLDELDHRVKNTLTVVQSIAAQTLRGSQTVEEVRSLFEGRLLALSRVHNLLVRSEWAGAGLRELIGHVLQPFGVDDPRGPFRVEGHDVQLSAQAASTLGILFHELATNAAKHGALLEGQHGEVEITSKIVPTPSGDRLALRWQERGGPPVDPPTHKGFGSRLIERGLAPTLEGEVRLHYARDGVSCEIDMPAPREVV
jgi:PAS domain S-box-containing protein